MDNLEQRSAEWFAVRCGKVTASRVSDVIAKTKSGWGASRANYMAQLIAERLTGEVADSYSNSAMQWGIDHEDEARKAYEFYENEGVQEIGFVQHQNLESGASPDGLVGDDGLVEIKCPNTATHIQTLLDQKIPKKYETQMLWQMECTGRKWCDFVSYDPRMPEGHLKLFVRRFERDDKRLDEIRGMVADFIGELEDKLTALEKLEK
jgi:putative phage-type endonuclease